MKKLIAILALITGCAQTPIAEQVPPAPTQEPPVETQTPQVPPPSTEPATTAKLSWPRHEWDAILTGEVTKNFDNLMMATDVQGFCPKFKSLSKDKQIQAFSEILIGVMKFESAWDPTSRMKEDLGIDHVTGLQVWSEGLLQLSYGDKEWAPWCEFNWAKDRLLPIAQRTITDPRINMACGVRIFANQVKAKKLLAPSKGYWAVMNTSSRYTKVSEIKARVSSLGPCK